MMPDNMKTVRKHDQLYLAENRKHHPKEYFKFILSIAKPHLSSRSNLKLLDIGCATGDFVYYLKSNVSSETVEGMDLLPELIKKAGEEVPGCHFFTGDICRRETLPAKKYDAIFMNGVHTIFESLHPWLENVLSLVTGVPGARVYLFGLFNAFDLDVLIKARSSNANPDDPWEVGWNSHSMKSVGKALKKLGVTQFKFHDFNIPIDLPPHADDPLRSWTFRYEDGSRGIMNGALVLHTFKLLEISV